MKNAYRTVLVASIACFSVPAFAQGNPAGRNCYQLALQGHGDGFYEIQPDANAPEVVFTVYCHDMGGFPRDFLPLARTGGDYNFGQFTAGGARPGTNVRTSYQMLRFDPVTMVVDIGDSTFATTTGYTPGENAATALGTGGDCIGSGVPTGAGNIDLTGTPFVMEDNFFAATGWAPVGSFALDGGVPVTLSEWNVPVAQRSIKRKAVRLDVLGGGYCGQVTLWGLNAAAGGPASPTSDVKPALRLSFDHYVAPPAP